MEIARTATFDAESLRELGELASHARDADGAAPFSDHMWEAARTGATTLVLTARGGNDDDSPSDGTTSGSGGGALLGAAFAAIQGDRLAAELVVHPDHRRHGHGGRLLAALLDGVDGELWVWSHGDHPAAVALARRHGLDRARELLQLRRAVGPGGPPLPDAPPPDGVSLRPFVVGHDESAWLEVNNAAFAWHPEQGGQTLDDLRSAEVQPDFDPAGFFLAVDAAGDGVGDGAVLGFHWTKVHRHDPDTGEGPPVGEVYVLGVAPSAHRRGLGAALTVAGLRHLAYVAGIGTVLLYVEGDNAAARTLYERLGFTTHAIHIAYRHP